MNGAVENGEWITLSLTNYKRKITQRGRYLEVNKQLLFETNYNVFVLDKSSSANEKRQRWHRDQNYP